MNKMGLNANNMKLNINKMWVNIDKMRLYIHKMWLSINKIRLNINNLRLKSYIKRDWILHHLSNHGGGVIYIWFKTLKSNYLVKIFFFSRPCFAHVLLMLCSDKKYLFRGAKYFQNKSKKPMSVCCFE